MNGFVYLLLFICSALQVTAKSFDDRHVSDTVKWHPEAIYVMRPEMKVVCKLPRPEDQDRSGVANLFFQCRETGIIHLIDSIDKNNHRFYNPKLVSGKYDVILLYNNGKYIRHNDAVFEPSTIVEITMENLSVQPSDSESQQWLTLRSYNNPVPIMGVRPNYSRHFPFYSVPDTSKWHPETIYIVHPDMQMVFKLPDVKDQDNSGVFNLLFQCKATGMIHLLDTVTIRNRSFNSLLTSGGTYDAILLYNNGKYIKYNNVTFHKGTKTEVKMKNLRIQPSDSESQYWLTMRGFNTAIEDRLLGNNYGTASEKRIRGYIFEGEFGEAFWPPLISSTEKKVTSITTDGYFEIDCDNDTDIILNLSFLGFISQEIKIAANSGLFLVMEKEKE